MNTFVMQPKCNLKLEILEHENGCFEVTISGVSFILRFIRKMYMKKNNPQYRTC